MRKTLILVSALMVPAIPSAVAQQPGAGGAAVVASEPGKGVIAQAIEITASVEAIDKATRTVTLKTPENKLVDVACGEEVRNFDQIKVGDMVVVKYMRALSLELKKGGKVRERTDKEAAVRAAPGEKPAGAVGRQVTVMTDVVGVDPKNMIISLKGPKGRVVDLHVKNPDHFKVVKVGDQVEATYTEALAIAVEPAPKSGKK